MNKTETNIRFSMYRVLFGMLAAAVIAILFGGTPVHAADSTAVLAFSNDSIDETAAGSGYDISGTTLTITAAGTYDIKGSCENGSIVVGKSLSGVTLILDDLDLKASDTAPVVIKKGSTVNIHLEGSSVLTDNEDPADENSADEVAAAAFEGAAVKVKSGSNVTFCGGGDLQVIANAKNGIKGGSTAALVFNQSGKITVSGKASGVAASSCAVNNGISSDGSVEINQGSFDIKAANDGIKSCPDATDETEGTTVDRESAGTITINGGVFEIDVDGDAIQADTALLINNGTFDIKTMSGYNSSTFNSDTMSCKGLKASGDRAEEIGTEPVLKVTGGTFVMNCADDAVHSDAYATVTGGTFTINSGDDGMHADTSLVLGTEGSAAARDPYVTITNSYEGLEGGTVYMYQGVYHVTASDDGVNAAGGSDSSGQEPGGGFNPGGGFGPGSHESSASDYNIYISGGSLYVNCEGDGLDSNGGLYLTGGIQEVFSQSNGDNSALDADGTVSINGATVFTAGARPQMDPVQNSWFGTSQKYITSSSNASSGRVVNATLSGSILYSVVLPKAANFFMYSAPSLSSAPTLSFQGSYTSCKGGSHSHSWGESTVSAGVKTYTCTSCGQTETQTIAETVSVGACDHSVEVSEPAVDEGYTVTFAGDAGVSSITVYQTQDYTNGESVSAAGTTVSRNSRTGEPDSTGNGQINFKVNLNEGYTIASVTATSGKYKNIKGPADTGVENLYRLTKVNGDLTVTIVTEPSASGNTDGTDTGTADGTDTGAADGTETSTANGSVSGSTIGLDSGVTDASGFGKDGTAYGEGTAYEVVDTAITSMASDADPAGTVFGKIRLRSTRQTKKAITLAWNKPGGAVKYVVYGNNCGVKNKMKKTTSLSGSRLNVKKVAGKNVRKGRYYKFMVVALDKDNKVISTSKIIHIATKGGKVTNPKKVIVKNRKKTVSAVTLKKGKTVTIKSSVTKAVRKLKLKVHRRVMYESSNQNIATVTSKGKIRGIQKGTCYIYAYAQNGVYKRIKVTIK